MFQLLDTEEVFLIQNINCFGISEPVSVGNYSLVVANAFTSVCSCVEVLEVGPQRLDALRSIHGKHCHRFRARSSGVNTCTGLGRILNPQCAWNETPCRGNHSFPTSRRD